MRNTKDFLLIWRWNVKKYAAMALMLGRKNVMMEIKRMVMVAVQIAKLNLGLLVIKTASAKKLFLQN